jgi:Protein of unknown function (DUF998)
LLLGFKRQRSATDRDVDRAAQDPSAAEGAIREGYRPSRHPVSSLALGPRGQVQTTNFAVTGTLVLAGAAGLRHAADPALSSRAGRALIGAAGAGLIGAAAFATDRSAATRQEHPTRSPSPPAPA